MEAKDLRIGNLIYRVGHIHKVDWATIKLCAQRNKQFNEDFNPIELTEERLIDFGGKKIGNKFHFGYGFACIIDEDGDCRVLIKKADFTLEYVWLNTLKYAHQLQNLFYAYVGKEICEVTGTELTYR